jgi:kumamolisin
MRSRMRFWVPVLACAALLVLPLVPAASAAAPLGFKLALAGALAGSAPALPNDLAQPWATRSGYVPAYLMQVSDAETSTAPAVLVLVTLWPRDLSFYTPVAGAAPQTTDQLLSEYAPVPSVYDSVATYFVAQNLTIVHAWPDHLSLTVEGSAAQVGAAFGTVLLSATWEGRLVQLPDSVPTLPASIQNAISAVSGLSDGFTDFTVPLEPAVVPATLAARTTSLLSPSAVHGLYGLDGLYNYSGSAHWATGIGIALVLWGEGYAPSDIRGFFANYYPAGFPAITYAGYPVDGAPLPSESAVDDPSNVTSEMTLDLEWAGSAAPGATLSAVYAPDGPAKDNYSPSDPGLEDALSEAVESISGVRVVSMSFGTPDGSDPSFQAAFTQILADASARGITALAASGDTGGDAHLGCSGGASPEFPAVSEYVVAVGGTAPVLSVDTFGTVTGLASEPAWNRSGGGFSTTVRAPVWQYVGSASSPIQSAGGGRGIPDVAGPANDNVFFYNGQETAGAGTSFASPMWGGIIAEMDALRGTPLGFVTPRLYAVGGDESNRTTATGLVDITQGGNCLGNAGPGWDTSTGWGSPRALPLYQDLSGTYVNVSLTTSASSVAPGQTFGASVSVTNATSLAPIVGALVTFTLDSVNYVGPCGGAISSTSGSTAGSGDASSSLTVPGCYLGLDIQVTATVSGGPYFGSNVTTVHVNLIGLAGFLAFVQVFPYNYITFAVIMLVAVLVGWRVGNWRHRRNLAARRTGSAGEAGPSADPSAPPPTAAPASADDAPPLATAVTATAAVNVLEPEPSPGPTDSPIDPAPSEMEGATSPASPSFDPSSPPMELAATGGPLGEMPAVAPTAATSWGPAAALVPPISPASAPRAVGSPPRRSPPPRSPQGRSPSTSTAEKLASGRAPVRRATASSRAPAGRGAPVRAGSAAAARASAASRPICPVCSATASSGAATCTTCGASFA